MDEAEFSAAIKAHSHQRW